MAIWRFIKVIFTAVIVGAILIFFFSNLSPEANSLASKISFKFHLPPLPKYESIDFTVGYLLIISFVLGMILAAIIGAMSSGAKSKKLKMQKRTIRELEIEIQELRELLSRDRSLIAQLEAHQKINQLPENPEVQ